MAKIREIQDGLPLALVNYHDEPQEFGGGYARDDELILPFVQDSPPPSPSLIRRAPAHTHNDSITVGQSNTFVLSTEHIEKSVSVLSMAGWALNITYYATPFFYVAAFRLCVVATEVFIAVIAQNNKKEDGEVSLKTSLLTQELMINAATEIGRAFLEFQELSRLIFAMYDLCVASQIIPSARQTIELGLSRGTLIKV